MRKLLLGLSQKMCLSWKREHICLVFTTWPFASNRDESTVGVLEAHRASRKTRSPLKHNHTFFYRLWGSSLSSLTLISAALVRRWSDEASAWMNNAGTPANKRRHPLTPFHGAAPYARVPRAFKLPPSAPVWKKKRKEKKKSRWQQKAT